jgi:predicted aspartyl protease
MGLTYADITLLNGEDITLARKYFIGEEEVRKIEIKMLVNTGAFNLCINEEIQSQMQFPIVGKRQAVSAEGRIVECDMVDNVEVRFKNMSTTCRAMVLPCDCQPQLGAAIPLGDMPDRLPYLRIL